MRTLLATICLIFSAATSAAVMAQGGTAPERQTPAQEMPPFDAAPLLEAMIALRSAALTCDPYVSGAPLDRTSGIVAYFETLRQQLPDLSDTETQTSLNRFIGSQAAMLCSEMLDEAFDDYQVQAQIYEDNRPEAWPAAPAAPKSAWCASNYCLDQ